MKIRDYRTSIHAASIGLLLGLMPNSLSAAYSIDWWTIDSGGEMRTVGGNYELSGTIGQPDAGGPLLGGNFELVGGFWLSGAAEPFCFGDLDGDLDIDLSDLAQLLGHYGTPSGAAYEDGDLDGDGDVDLSDLAALLGVYGTNC